MSEVSDRPASEEPLYNIGVVARMTGIPVATLRIWERRYGFPASARTAGGHRLYSEREINRLRWVKAQVDAGVQISQAIRSLEHLTQQGRAADLLLAAPSEPTTEKVSILPLRTLRERLVATLLSHDTEKADQILGEAMAVYPIETLVLEGLGPALADIGEAWMEGRIGIATEHLATNYLRHRLLMWMFSGPPAYLARPTVLACAPGEWHEGSLLILGVLLRRRRWPVAYLGQSLPLADLARLTRDLKPLAIVFVAMTEEPAKALAEWPRWLPEAHRTGRPLVGFGGRIFTTQPEWQEKVPGTFLGATLTEGLANLERMLRAAAFPSP